MNIRKSEDVLKFWQEVWGTLQPIWHKKFLKHRSMKEILTHPSDHIKVAIRRNQKLADVASDLRKQVARTEEFLDKYDKYRNSREVETGSKIENREREGNRWGRTF
jgi:hypothetical protein